MTTNLDVLNTWRVSNYVQGSLTITMKCHGVIMRDTKVRQNGFEMHVSSQVVAAIRRYFASVDERGSTYF